MICGFHHIHFSLQTNVPSDYDNLQTYSVHVAMINKLKDETINIISSNSCNDNYNTEIYCLRIQMKYKMIITSEIKIQFARVSRVSADYTLVIFESIINVMKFIDVQFASAVIRSVLVLIYKF